MTSRVTPQAHVLVACEVSGVVSRAFRAAGPPVMSCDLLPSDDSSLLHYQGDVRNILKMAGAFSLLIAHPPCQYLAVSGARWFKHRQQEQAAALAIIQTLLDAPIPYIALENPIGVISTRIRKPDQIIQPWQFGHPESKATCLWLKGLPPLTPTDGLERPAAGHWHNQTPSGQNKLGPSPNRSKLRSITYTGIAQAMAAQWGAVLNRASDETSAPNP